MSKQGPDVAGVKFKPVSESYWKINLAMLLASQILIMCGFSAMNPFIGLFIKEKLAGGSDAVLATGIALYSFFGDMGYALFNPVWGKLSDRFGVKPMLLRGTFLSCLFFPFMGYVRSIWLLIVLRFISAGMAGTTAASQLMVVRTVPENRQGFALGVLTAGVWSGSLLGVVAGGYLTHYYDYSYAFWFCGILYCCAGFLILFTKDDVGLMQPMPKVPEFNRHGREKLFPAFTVAVLLMFAMFVVWGFIRKLEIPYIALRIENIVGSETAKLWTSRIGIISAVGAIVSGLTLGSLADKFKPQQVFVPCLLISGTMLVLQGVASNLWVFGGSQFIFYVTTGGIQPAMQKVLSQITPRRKRGTVFGCATSMVTGGGMFAALLGGYAFSLGGAALVFYLTAACFYLATPLFVILVTQAQKPVRFRRRRKVAVIPYFRRKIRGA